ncbi:probable C-mannosyltransferase DPY19L4 [Rousettus aegyptiacus]|uniref:probable C-mannosyltransferase DPY19L4 n=1 Tax=Rousettus aegyptiacus TaxID=9407 RepID=UPI00168D016D|nr:probable C-mannosyltransferase DPY19L4 [Rousettus aegyptiacus]
MAEEEGSAIELRQRKKLKSSENKEYIKEEKISETPVPERAPKYVLFQHFAKIFIGCLAAVTSGMMYALYLSAYHERKFWFSTRQVRRKTSEHVKVVLVFNMNLGKMLSKEPI